MYNTKFNRSLQSKHSIEVIMSEKLIIKAITGKAHRSPVWMMRQAGRHLPEYRQLKEKFSFLELCKTPSAAAEASLQPLNRYNMDGVICFSDILVPLQAMGMDLDFCPGPVFSNPIQSIDDFRKLECPPRPIEEKVPHIMQTLNILKNELKGSSKTLLGFTGAPFTLATYAIEGKTSKNFEMVRAWAYQNSEEFHQILNGLADLVSEYILAQQRAGAEVVQLFDTWAGQLSLDDYRLFAHPYTTKIIQTAKTNNLPIVLYINGGSHLISAMVESKPDVVSVDWRLHIRDYLELIPDDIAIQGNLDPGCLFAPVDIVVQKTEEILEATKDRPNHILNLGHGILPTTPIPQVEAFVSTALEYSKRQS